MLRPYVFISYARRDAPFATTLIRRLRASKLATWRDVDDLTGGQLWQQKVDDALRGAAALIVILSPSSSKSEYVTYEWAFALGAGVRVIPILRGRSRVHPRLTGIQFVDFRNPRRGKPWLRLLDAVKAEPSIVPGPTTAEIQAAFELDKGKPLKVGREYVIALSISRVPAGASRATYEIHDPTFPEPKWSERNPSQKFATTMRSYGDVLLSAIIHTKSRRTRLETTLYEALQRTHAGDRSRAVKKALRDIAEH